MELIESLTNLGLSDKEARVYLTLLPLRKATAYLVAIRSGLKRPTTYVILENLVNKGFALKMPEDGKMFFMAKSPRECFSIAQERMSSAKEALPELEAVQKEGSEKVTVSYFDGLDGVKEMYRGLMKSMKKKDEANRKFIGFFAHQKDTPVALQKYWDEMNEELRENMISRMAITTEHETVAKYLTPEAAKRLRVEVKAFPEDIYSSNISIEVYDNFTQIISHRYLQGILIENPDIANVMKQIFFLAWKSDNDSR